MENIVKKEIQEMCHDEIKSFITNYYKKYDETLICTSRVLDALATTVKRMILSKQIIGNRESIEELLGKPNTIEFIKERKPNINPVSNEVIENIKKYFSDSRMKIEPVLVCRISNHPEDEYLYAVIGQQHDRKYVCYTSWNNERKSLNYGHYNLPSERSARAIIDENFNDISGDRNNYGPDNTFVEIGKSRICEKTMDISEDEKIVSVKAAKRGR